MYVPGRFYKFPINFSLKIPGFYLFSKLFLVLTLAVFISILAIGPARGSYEQIRELEEDGYQREARRRYESFVADNPSHADGWRGLIRTALATERWEIARDALEKYDDLEPEEPWTALKLAQVFFYRDQFDTAHHWAETFQQRAPERWEPFHASAQINLARRNYVQARDNVASARQRTSDNPWILTDQFLVRLNLDGEFDEELLEEILELAENPVIYWRIVQSPHLEQLPERIRQLLAEGYDYFPGEPPPFLPPADREEYRYWLARAHYDQGDLAAARRLLPEDNDELRVRWLRLFIEENEEERLENLNDLLTVRPDHLAYQWLNSRFAREREGLGGTRRQNSADYFYEEHQTLYRMNYNEAALSAMMRSLEMHPLDSDRQFQLTRFFQHRGWERQLERTLGRVRELGFSPPERIEDYAEGFRGDTPPEIPPNFSSPVGRVYFDLQIPSFWEGPPGGAQLLESIFEQAFFHQPNFELYTRDDFEEVVSPVALIREGMVDGVVEISVDNWDERLRAEIEIQFGDELELERMFHGTRRVKIWRLLDDTISALRQEWPWEGNIFDIGSLEVRVNLGDAHGVSTGDSFEVGDYELPVAEVFERQSVLELPTPVYAEYLERGDSARLIRAEENNN